MRIQRFLARAGLASRREAKSLIEKGLVRVNGQVISEPFFQVNPENDLVEFKGKKVKIPENWTYIILNKPRKVITTVSDELGRKTVMDFISCKEKGLVPVGRLDEESEGLLLITNDGDLVHGLTHPSFEIEKEYEVTLPRTPGKELKKMEEGIQVGNDRLKASRVIFKKGNKVNVTLKEGKNREIRRMLGTLGYRAERLKRIRIGNIRLSGLKAGQWRELTRDEVFKLKGLVCGKY
jgi:23S rRNA pseudouridine2605 synthase